MEDEIKPKINEDKATEYLDENNRFKVGNPGGGRKPEDQETKLIRKARKEIIEDYKQALAEALPMIQPVLIAKAIEGDITAIKEIHDRSMDKAKQATDVTTNGESINPLLVQFIGGESTNTK